MERITDDVINKIIKDHGHWLNKDCDGWQDLKADLKSMNLYNANLSLVDLSFANLSRADLSKADLSGANLREADLSLVNLCDADLRNTNLSYANLSGADLVEANLRGADLSDADLRDTNLGGADLRCANLSRADLSCANLIFADLTDANLSGANLSCADLRDSKGPLMEYRKGKILTEDIIGYKKCKNNVIVTLKIPRGAIVFSINGYKCRTNKVKVIDIDGSDRAISIYKYMSYYVGDEITVYNFNCEYNIENAEGIHFYMTREDAENHD